MASALKIKCPTLKSNGLMVVAIVMIDAMQNKIVSSVFWRLPFIEMHGTSN